MYTHSDVKMQVNVQYRYVDLLQLGWYSVIPSFTFSVLVYGCIPRMTLYRVPVHFEIHITF